MGTKAGISCLAAICIALQVSAQDWTLGGNNIVGTDWFGANTGSAIPLSFETRVNQPMLWSTNNVRRMRLSGTLTGQTINGYGGLELCGVLGVGEFKNSFPLRHQFHGIDP